MKTNPDTSLVRRLAGLFVRHLQLAAALGSWSYRAPYDWEFELVNARWPRPARDAGTRRRSASAAPACCLAVLSLSPAGGHCAAC
jgi:hypothetical protein